MKILRTTGIVVGIHALVLLVIFINPGCSSTTKADATPADTNPAPAAANPAPAGSPAVESAPAVGMVPVASTNAFYAPTRPNSTAAGALEPAAPVADVTPAATYSVKSGDSMWLIAHRNHLKVSELAAANGIKATATLHAGQKLLIPNKAPAPVAAETPAAANAPGISLGSAAAAPKSAGETKYTVRPGEALSTIAKRFGLTTGDLATKNNITDPRKIRPGQELIIPAGHVAKPSKKGRKTTGSTAAASGPSSAPAAETPPAPAPAPDTTAPAADATPTVSVPIIKIDGADNPPAPAK